MSHNDLHITRDHDAGKTTAAREKHSMTLRAMVDGVDLVTTPAVVKVEFVPVKVKGRRKRKPRLS